MKTVRIFLSLFVCVLFLGGPAASRAEEGQSAFKASIKLEDRYGSKPLANLVEMRGDGGQPQPTEWWFTVHNKTSKYLMHTFWVGMDRITDEGDSGEYYPKNPPSGFFNPARLKLDSSDAFTIAETAAKKAGIGFDWVDYRLRCREFSNEPVWILKMYDKWRQLAGSVAISAHTGTVLRTIWIRRASIEPWVRPEIKDSAHGPPASPKGD